MKKSILLGVAIGAMTVLAHFAQAQNTVTYTFIAFDVPFSGASNTKAFAINPRGDVVGRYFDANQGGNPRGFLRHADGTFAPPIDVPVANTGTVARGIDARGDIVGKYFDSNGSGQTHGFYLSGGGAFTSFDVTLSGAITGSTYANSLNNLGQIVGQYSALTAVTGCSGLLPIGRGFLRNTDGSFTPIDFPGATATVAWGIDDSGNTVGMYVTVPANNHTCDTSAVVNVHGFLRDPKGNFTTLDAPASSGAMNTIVFRINDSGDVTGIYSPNPVTFGELTGDTAVTGTVHNFVLLNNGSFTSFDIPFGGGGSTRGINPRGNIVGVYDDGAGDHGFLGTK